MLNMLKSMINEKKSFMESSQQDALIMEDNEALDDSIVLNEEPDEIPEENKPEEKPETTPAEQPAEPLPEPIGAQTGEPAKLGDDDLLSQEIDLGTNTPKDTLPVPPAGASDAVVDDNLLDQPIDSGFGAEPTPTATDVEDILDQPIDNPDPVNNPAANGPAEDSGSGDILSEPIEDEGDIQKPVDSQQEESSDILNQSIDDSNPVNESVDFKNMSAEDLEAWMTKKVDAMGQAHKNLVKLYNTPRSTAHDQEVTKNLKISDAIENEMAKAQKEFADKEVFNKISDKVLSAAEKKFNESSEASFNDILNQPMTEAITLGGEAEATPAEGGEAAPDADQGSDNVVTQAVKDKVEEINTPADDTTGGEEGGEEGEVETLANETEGQKALQKKLSNLTKEIENIKSFVVDNLQ